MDYLILFIRNFTCGYSVYFFCFIYSHFYEYYGISGIGKVQERNLQKTKLGTIVITCAAADDITAWCILAAVIAIVKAGSFTSSIYVIIMAIAYVFLMIKIVRPFLKRIGDLQAGKIRSANRWWLFSS
jgi:hypothetical protein